MRKNNVWKQALALVLAATLAVGNGAPVSAAAGDSAANDGAAGGTPIVTNMDAYKKLTFDFEDGQTMVSGDDAYYVENGIHFKNESSQVVVTDENGKPITSEGNPNMSEGVEVVDASSIPEATDADKEHGKVIKFDVGKTNEGTKDTGIDYLTSTEGALASYDYSNGVTFSFDIRPETQGDWNYLFAFGQFMKYNVTGTIGFIAAYESIDKTAEEGGGTRPSDGLGQPWTPFFPGDGGWVEGNNVNSAFDYFNIQENCGKWHKMSYIYTKEGLTIAVNDVPAVTYKDPYNHMEALMKNMSKGQLRLGKGVLPDLEGFVGYMDNITIQPVHPGAHEYGTEILETQQPSCTEAGWNRVKCSMCGFIATLEIPATGHTYGDLVAEKAATCTEQGNLAHYRCTSCNGYFVSDTTAEDGKKPVSKTEVTIDAKGHDYVKDIKKATDKADGVIASECKVCQDKTTEVIPMASNITLAKSSYKYTGKEIKPEVTVKDSKGNEIAAENYTVSYANNTKVGTATATITFKGENYEGVVNKTFKITAAASLSLNKSKVTLYTGKASKSIKVTAKVEGSSKAVKWDCDKKKIAKVDQKGNITALKAGTATVTAKANGITKKVKVTVKNPTITLKKGKKNFTKKTVDIKRNKSVTLNVSVKPAKSGMAVSKLTAKQKRVATVTFKNGKLTIKGKKKGSIKIKVTSGKGAKTLTVKVK
ncbi:MAG: hypothetical protein HFH36_12175 [Lachnospiraceae bacterium]|nr:hypothetical protein [Lachnospiraceae bacterium]